MQVSKSYSDTRFRILKPGIALGSFRRSRRQKTCRAVMLLLSYSPVNVHATLASGKGQFTHSQDSMSTPIEHAFWKGTRGRKRPFRQALLGLLRGSADAVQPVLQAGPRELPERAAGYHPFAVEEQRGRQAAAASGHTQRPGGVERHQLELEPLFG